jgi:hypothetical protein
MLAYWASVALQLKAHVTAWGGLKGMIWQSELEE